MDLNDINRREFGLASLGGMLAGAAGLGAAGSAQAATSMVASGQLPASILDLLGDLDVAAAQIADTWRPDDPEYRAILYRQIMMNLSWAYFAHFHADAEHPDWAPLWNPVYTDQPNPDDIYLYAPIRGDLTYRVSGDRGTSSLLTFNTQKGWVGLVEGREQMSHGRDFDNRSITVGPDGQMDIIFSAERPAGHTGDWAQIAPEADALVMRCRMVDWQKERDPRLSIECLDPVPPKRRLTPEEIVAKIREMAKLPYRFNNDFFGIQNRVKAKVGVNRFVQEQYPGGGLSKQIYWPAVFELDDGEALIVETEMPKRRYYWNIQMNDPVFNAVEYVYRIASINESTASFSSDGKFRAVVALEDPGVPNWLDPAGFRQGTIYGRWYDCDSAPVPVIKRVPLAELRRHLPDDTPVVTPAQRAEQLRARVVAAQRRRRW